MNIRVFASAAAIAAGGLLAASGDAGATSDPKVLSPANQALFTTNHMASITQPTVIEYDFEKKGSLESGFTDTVQAEVTKVHSDGGRDLTFHFLSGANHVEFRDFEDHVGNPIFMLFLERDVRELQRLTHGSALYFRDRIRNALAGDAAVKPTTFSFEGKTHEGTEIRIQPYANDPLNERYPQYAKKTYVFIMSKEIPGGFYKVDATTPNPSADLPFMEESVTFHDAHGPDQKRAEVGHDSVANTSN